MSDFSPPGGPPPPPPPSPDEPPQPGWWKASDGNWYPPEQAPQHQAPPPPGAQPYGHGPQGYQPYTGGQEGNSIATWSLGLGIASIVLCWAFGFGILLGILAIIFGIVGNNKARQLPGRTNEGKAKAGLITGILGTIGGALFLVFLVAIADDVVDEMERQQDDGICDENSIFDPDC